MPVIRNHTKTDFHNLFTKLRLAGPKRIAFCGIDEVTEIAYLSLKEAGLELVAIFDAESPKKDFLGHEILRFDDIKRIDPDMIVITSFKADDELKDALLEAGVDGTKIYSIGLGGWLKKIEGPAI